VSPEDLDRLAVLLDQAGLAEDLRTAKTCIFDARRIIDDERQRQIERRSKSVKDRIDEAAFEYSGGMTWDALTDMFDAAFTRDLRRRYRALFDERVVYWTGYRIRAGLPYRPNDRAEAGRNWPWPFGIRMIPPRR